MNSSNWKTTLLGILAAVGLYLGQSGVIAPNSTAGKINTLITSLLLGSTGAVAADAKKQ